MKSLQYRIQTLVNQVQWDWGHSGYKVPADIVALEFVSGLITANFKDELDGRVIALEFTPQNRLIKVTVGKTQKGTTRMERHYE